MTKKLIAGLLIIIVLLGAGLALVLMVKRPATAPSTPTSVSTNDATSTMNMAGQGAQTQPVVTDKVSIKDFAYTPATITVKKGTAVTWTNQDTTKHTVSPNEETADFKASGLLAQGQTYTVTFTTAGTFAYHCAPHPDMKGTVIVTD